MEQYIKIDGIKVDPNSDKDMEFAERVTGMRQKEATDVMGELLKNTTYAENYVSAVSKIAKIDSETAERGIKAVNKWAEDTAREDDGRTVGAMEREYQRTINGIPAEAIVEYLNWRNTGALPAGATVESMYAIAQVMDPNALIRNRSNTANFDMLSETELVAMEDAILANAESFNENAETVLREGAYKPGTPLPNHALASKIENNNTSREAVEFMKQL